MLKVFRPEKILQAVSEYVAEQLGNEYLEAPAVDLGQVHADSDCFTPIIFVLSPGADPNSQLNQFVDKQHMEARFRGISLG